MIKKRRVPAVINCDGFRFVIIGKHRAGCSSREDDTTRVNVVHDLLGDGGRDELLCLGGYGHFKGTLCVADIGVTSKHLFDFCDDLF